MKSGGEAQRLQRRGRLFCKTPKARRRSVLAEAVSAESLYLTGVLGCNLELVHHSVHQSEMFTFSNVYESI